MNKMYLKKKTNVVGKTKYKAQNSFNSKTKK